MATHRLARPDSQSNESHVCMQNHAESRKQSRRITPHHPRDCVSGSVADQMDVGQRLGCYAVTHIMYTIGNQSVVSHLGMQNHSESRRITQNDAKITQNHAESRDIPVYV